MNGTATGTHPARQIRQIGVITAGAVALFVLVRRLPTGTNLAHVDFQPRGAGALQFCDPGNPAFLPVMAVRSPVSMDLRADGPVVSGRRIQLALTLRTASGKPIGPRDLLVTHAHLLHLMIVDPSLRDYQHVHPAPGAEPGEWTTEFEPRRAGAYRLFADFTPEATGRGLYASADLDVPGRPGAQPPEDNWVCESDGLRFALATDGPLRARAVVTLALSIENAEAGKPVPLEPTMGAWAHLVAIDAARSGFAHLHPQQADLTKRPDEFRPRFTFQIQLPDPGRYVVWSQVRIAGRDRFAPFWVKVEPCDPRILGAGLLVPAGGCLWYKLN